MATRFRWFSVGFGKKTIEQVATLLVAKPLSEDSDRGFTLTAHTTDVISFRFFTRTSIIITGVDSDGVTTHGQVETLNMADFALVSTEGAVFLRAQNPGRTLRELFNAIGEIVGLGFTVAPIVFSKHAPKGFLVSFSARKLLSIKVRGAVPGTPLVAVMEFVSPDGLVVDQLPFPTDLEYQVVQATYEISYKLGKGQIAFFSNGMVRVTGELGLKLIGLVETELTHLDRRANLFRP